MSDHEQIRALLARYNLAIDAGDTAGWAACFTADGAFESTGVESEPVRVEAGDLPAFATRQHEINQGRGRHWTTNELIEVDGDTATMQCYLLAVTTGRRIAATGIYRDQLRKVDGRWLFAPPARRRRSAAVPVRGSHRHMSIDIDGDCPERFAAVKDAFADNFANNGDIGASVAITLGGELVVDLWGGTLDEAGTTPWQRDTIISVFSTTKTMSCLSLLVLASRGLVDVDAPVARYWPEFAANGKEGVLVRHLLSHTAGLPAWDERITTEDLYDWDKVCALLAAQAPWWEPGSKSGYHAISQGNLVGEVVRRVDGRSVGDVLRRGDRRPGRRRLPHRHAGGVRRPRRPGHPGAADHVRQRRRFGRGRPRLDPLPRRQPAAGRRGVVDDPVAPGRDPGRRRARQRPQRRPRPVGRVGRWRRSALEGDGRADLRRAGRRT